MSKISGAVRTILRTRASKRKATPLRLESAVTMWVKETKTHFVVRSSVFINPSVCCERSTDEISKPSSPDAADARTSPRNLLHGILPGIGKDSVEKFA